MTQGVRPPGKRTRNHEVTHRSIEVYANKARVAGWTVVTAVLAAAATIPIVHPDPESGIPIVSLVAAIFVLLLLVVLIGHSLTIPFSSQPFVIVTDQGITIQSLLFGVSLIPSSGRRSLPSWRSDDPAKPYCA